MLDSPERKVVFGLAVVDFLFEEIYLLKVSLSFVPVKVHFPLHFKQSLLDMFFHLLEVLYF
jgi:hypothetical protein